MFSSEGLLKDGLSLQGLLIAQHGVIILPQHLPERQEEEMNREVKVICTELKHIVCS